MNAARRNAYLGLLEWGILKIRGYACNGQCDRIIEEANHIHNLPKILLFERAEDEDYYWRGERIIYLKNMAALRKPGETAESGFEELWKQLEENP